MVSVIVLWLFSQFLITKDEPENNVKTVIE